MSGSLSGRVAIVTGAGSGMGRAHAWLMAERGARVVVQDIDEAGARDTAEGVGNRGTEAMLNVFDIAEVSSIERMVAAAESRFGRVDILVNNAGIGIDRPIEEIDEAAFDRMMEVHVKGSFFCARSVVPGMKKRRHGRIINVASRWAMAGHDCASDYIAAKGALLGFTKAWAKELAPHNITVNALAPGGVWSRMVMQTLGEEGIRREEKAVPLGRWAQPVEIAYSVAYLASDEAAFITGQVFAPNGGKTIVGF